MGRKKELMFRLFERIWSSHTMMLLEYNPQKDIIRNVENRFAFADINNINDVLEFENIKYVETYRHMLDNGEVGILGYLNEKCVFRHWIQMEGNIVHEGKIIKSLDEKSCYSHYVFCAVEARKHGFHSDSIQVIKNKYPEHKIYTLVNTTNNKSMRNYLNANFKKVKEIKVTMRLFKKNVVISDIESNS